MICLQCKEFSFQRVNQTHAKGGMGACAHREKFILFGARTERDCAKFVLAEPDIIAKRDAFVRK